jgi:hypothetical protein
VMITTPISGISPDGEHLNVPVRRAAMTAWNWRQAQRA